MKDTEKRALFILHILDLWLQISKWVKWQKRNIKYACSLEVEPADHLAMTFPILTSETGLWATGQAHEPKHLKTLMKISGQRREKNPTFQNINRTKQLTMTNIHQI